MLNNVDLLVYSFTWVAMMPWFIGFFNFRILVYASFLSK